MPPSTPDPFPAALRAAITASGLPLDRIRYRLELRDVSVSVPTLSNWQSGRRQPERPESLRALAELENVLDLPPAALRSLLGPPRPRGRARPTGTQAFSSVWGDDAIRLLSAVDTRWDSRLVRLSQHDTVRVGTSGQLSQVHTRQVLRAGRPGADRWILLWDSGPAEIVPLRHCRLGRSATGNGLTAAELLFDRPLAHGATTIVEYAVRGQGGDRFLRRFHLPTRDYLLEVLFDPAAPPAQVSRTDSPEILALTPSGSAHLVGLNVSGTVGIRWRMR
ncbi:MAG: hypothetical protein ABW215_15735 [Kibdelosporangium sp.]